MLVRLLGLTALLATAAGALVLASELPDLKLDSLTKAVSNQLGQNALIGAWLLIGGVLVTVFAATVEILSMLQPGAGRRSAAGFNAAFQVGLAVALLVAVNAYAFLHDATIDATSNKQFTLPENIISELQKLKSETTIVVLQQHKTFGQLSAKPDRYDYAAERKVVEKVQDLVDRFRKFGPQFRVVVLDVEEEGYDRKLDDLTKDKPSLKTAIHAAPENSIFFYSEGKVQRMSFNEFYQLDKHASKTANGGKGNLVLYPQGIETLVRRVTAIEEKRPKIAIAVVHELLTSQASEGNDEFAMSGLRKSLTEHGFDVVDVVVRKNLRRGPTGIVEGDPASFTFQESKLTRLEAQLESRKNRVNSLREDLEIVAKIKDPGYERMTTPQRIKLLNKVYEMMTGDPEEFSEAELNSERVLNSFEKFVLPRLEAVHTELKQALTDAETNLKQVTDDLARTQADERAIEDFYLTDVKPKFTRLLDDCDMLIIPRLTILSATTQGGVLPRGLHRLDRQQMDIVKDFMKAGKPVLVCAGPSNYPSAGQAPPDELESALADRGIELGRQTILFNVESEAFRERAAGPFGAAAVQVPPLSLIPPEDRQTEGLKPNPIARSMRVLLNSVDDPLDIRIRAPRPVSVTKQQQQAQGFAAEFLWTSRESWSENYPFAYAFQSIPQIGEVPVPRKPPRLDDSPADDKGLGKRERERRGPFAIAVAVEGPAPARWYTDKEKRPADAPKSRLAVIGHGGIFTRSQLNAATEQLALVTCNWLLRREERMPHAAVADAPIAADRTWEYPRVAMSDGSKKLWHWGAFLGLPAVFVYLGLIVLMLRRVR
jgi:hypothetical protein